MLKKIKKKRLKKFGQKRILQLFSKMLYVKINYTEWMEFFHMKQEMIWLIWFEIKRNVFIDLRFGAAYGAGAW